ncbi:MAG: serine aminopeptidase domain-containing protein, partial [Gemmatimonadaceae bacterium]
MRHPTRLLFVALTAMALAAGALQAQGRAASDTTRRAPARQRQASDTAAAAERKDYSAPLGAPYTAQDVTVSTPMGHTLAGTLTLPHGASRTSTVPAVVTITGSGAQDRDESLGSPPGYRPFRQLADSLGRRGIAVLRMDDRGHGASTGNHRAATSADFAEDIRAGLAYLRTRPEIDA